MSMAGENSPLDLDALTDEVIRLHRLATPQQPVAGAVQDFVLRVGRSREGIVLRELIAEKIRQRVQERLQEAASRPMPRTAPKRREGIAPLRVAPAPGEIADPETLDIPVPEPVSPEEFRPGAMLVHTTESAAEPDAVVQEPPSFVARQVPDMLAGLVPEPELEQRLTEMPAAEELAVPRPPVPARPKAAPQQPSRRLASFRNTTPEETWPALAELVDVGGVSKRHLDVTREDQVIRLAFFESAEKEAAKNLTEANKRFGSAHQETVLAKRELDALRRHDAEKIGDLPDYELDRLYGRRAA